ncbi:MAG TPA: cobalamin biosynthesis protein [Kutzneria sp.]|nr:cobalamin biosynthesis protein [Kutzneria sp.]
MNADLVVGVGCRPGTAEAAVREVVTAVLERHGLTLGEVRAFATVTARADEPALRAIAGDTLLAYPAEVLDRVAVPHRSARVAAAVGTASVAEAAALHAAAVLAGPEGVSTLVAGRFSGPAVTAAVARIVERTGHLGP